MELHFTADYNATELEETVRTLGPKVVVEFRSCRQEEAEAKERRAQRVLFEDGRTQRWKAAVEAANVEELCAKAKTELQARNANKRFWESADQPSWSLNPTCPCFRATKQVDIGSGTRGLAHRSASMR